MDVEAALRYAFSFEKRSLGQKVALSEVVAAIQGVPGVAAVTVTKLYRSNEAPSPHPVDITASDLPEGSELITLDPSSLKDADLVVV